MARHVGRLLMLFLTAQLTHFQMLGIASCGAVFVSVFVILAMALWTSLK